MRCNYAFVTRTSNFVEHSALQWGNFEMRLVYTPPNTNNNNTNNSSGGNGTNNNTTDPIDNSGGGIIDIRDELIGYDVLYLHGWLLWSAWGVLGFV